MRSKYSALPAGVSNAGMRVRWTLKSITSAPAAAPTRNTRTRETTHATFGSHDLPADAGRSMTLVLLISRQRDQHAVLRGRRVERGGFLLRQDRVRRRTGRELRFPRCNEA